LRVEYKLVLKMVQVITISTSGDFIKADRILGRIKKQLPAMTIRAMIKWGKILERDMKTSVRQASIDFRGTSQQKGIEWRQGKKSYVGFLFMRQYLLALDHMKPHYVSVKRSRGALLSWAKQSKSISIRRRAKMVEKRELKSFGIFVKPHPFIDNGYRRSRPKLTPILRRMTERAVKV